MFYFIAASALIGLLSVLFSRKKCDIPMSVVYVLISSIGVALAAYYEDHSVVISGFVPLAAISVIFGFNKATFSAKLTILSLSTVCFILTLTLSIFNISIA
tara:strand:+ start:1561 stop:1863 length:303 start_codon:yes stop_codon:yes gene_type:complete